MACTYSREHRLPADHLQHQGRRSQKLAPVEISWLLRVVSPVGAATFPKSCRMSAGSLECDKMTASTRRSSNALRCRDPEANVICRHLSRLRIGPRARKAKQTVCFLCCEPAKCEDSSCRDRKLTRGECDTGISMNMEGYMRSTWPTRNS